MTGSGVQELQESGDRDLSAAATSVTPGVTWARLEDQLRWYDRKSVAAQRKYKGVKLLQLPFSGGARAGGLPN